ncbi:MAG: galactokinase [Kiritimatiellae bacterium]|nr:galactokinase [Kiritimatiellia bacterium]
MINEEIYNRVSAEFIRHFGCSHTIAAYAPGRVEVIGNHTDYNMGTVLSAAIDIGTFFLAAPSTDNICRLVAGDIMSEVSFNVSTIKPSVNNTWSNYVKGVFAGLLEIDNIDQGFLGMFLGNIPIGMGLSSSAALEISSALTLSTLYNINIEPMDMARIGQKAEHEYADVKCGLLDQITSLFGQDNELVMTDFRTLEVSSTPLHKDLCLIICDTGVKHALVESKYNERRLKCEEATRFFASRLDHPVDALCDVTPAELREHKHDMDEMCARCAEHVIGENDRVLKGKALLDADNPSAFGKLMFESHESSRLNFKNSCKELDFLVERSAGIPGILGARLSGGGFGGSIVVLVHRRDADIVKHAISSAYKKEFDYPCRTRTIVPSAGASLIDAVV